MAAFSSIATEHLAQIAKRFDPSAPCALCPRPALAVVAVNVRGQARVILAPLCNEHILQPEATDQQFDKLEADLLAQRPDVLGGGA